MPSLSFCTAVMNRTHHLKMTLPENLASQPQRGVEFVIANYGSRDDLDEWIHSNFRDEMRTGRIRYVRNRRPRYFHHSKAKNCAHRAAQGDIVCNLDADNIAGRGLTDHLRDVFSRETDSLVQFVGNYSAHGRIALLRHHFEELGGYDESFAGWGLEDYELVNRACALRHLTLEKCELRQFAGCLDHSDEARLENMSPLLARLGKQGMRAANERRMRFSSPQWKRGALIPRLIHFLVLEGDTDSACQANRQTWRRWHPGWEFHVWTETEAVDRCGPVPGEWCAESRRAWLHCRLLDELGGVVIHPRVRCGQPIDSRLRDITAAFCPGDGDVMFWFGAGFRRHSLPWELSSALPIFQADDRTAAFHRIARRHHWSEITPGPDQPRGRIQSLRTLWLP